MRLFLLSLALAASVFVATTAAAQQPAPVTTISGGGLPQAITLSAVDHDAFVRRLDLPPLLDEDPKPGGPSYTVISPYWDEAVRDGDEEEPRVADAATYYPSGGFVRTRQGNEDVWTALDFKQKAILDRYLRLGTALTASPTAFEVMRAAAATETIGITIGDIELTPEQRASFWEASRTLAPRQLSAPATGEPPPKLDERNQSIAWITFSLPEGRTVAMLYSAVTGIITEQREILQRNTFIPVPADWLVPVLGDAAKPGPTFALQPLEVPQGSGHGSPVWWLIASGGGVAAIAAALFLQRRFAAA